MNEQERWRTSQKISVMIVDDHPMFRDGLQKWLELEDDIAVVEQCDNGEAALRLAVQRKPDVVILDINLPQVNGLQVARQMKTDHSATAVIMLTAYHDDAQVLHAMKSGASAYCKKDITPDKLLQTIRDVANGYYVVNDQRMDEREVQSWLHAQVEGSAGHVLTDGSEVYVPLSPREMEILKCVTNGLSNKEIARRLRISQQTVKNHMTSILKKLNVQDRTQAAVMALSRGWVRVENENRGSAANK